MANGLWKNAGNTREWQTGKRGGTGNPSFADESSTRKMVSCARLMPDTRRMEIVEVISTINRMQAWQSFARLFLSDSP
jgi:hypothetical protein